MKTDFVYMLTLTHSSQGSFQLVGVWLDPEKAKKAKTKLIAAGVDEELLDIDVAPIGVLDLLGVDEPYTEGLVN